MIFKETLSRSRFIRSIASTAMVFSVPSSVFRKPRITVDGLHASTFESFVESIFTMKTQDASFLAQLVCVKNRNERVFDRTGHFDLDMFSLLFKTNTKDEVESGLYDVSHPVLGTFALFLSPTEVNGNKNYCEIVFSRIHRK